MFVELIGADRLKLHYYNVKLAYVLNFNTCRLLGILKRYNWLYREELATFNIPHTTKRTLDLTESNLCSLEC